MPHESLIRNVKLNENLMDSVNGDETCSGIPEYCFLAVAPALLYTYECVFLHGPSWGIVELAWL